MKRRLLMFLCCFVLSIGFAAAQSKVTGNVIYADDGSPVIGATVRVVGHTNIATITDANGEFTLNVPKGANQVTASYVGMVSKAVNITGNHLTIALQLDANNIDEIIVVAYGTAKKSAFTGSASVLKADNLEKRQVSNLTNAIAGSVAGVQVQSSNGQPGTSATIRIRGIGSLSASNTPLYVVDGIPFDGDISSINTQDIESMTVLKDAAAAALYGARGANGVILVTTKKGKKGEARITAEARLGTNSRAVSKYDVIEDPATYMETLYKAQYNGAIYNLGYSPANAHEYVNGNLFKSVGYQMYTLPQGEGLIGENGRINPNATLGYNDGQYFYTPDDWGDEMIESQMRQEYNVSVTGGTDRMNYYFSVGYLEDNGIVENSGFNRLTTRLNVDYQAKEWLKIGTMMSYTKSESKYPDEQTNDASSMNAFAISNAIAPVYPIFVRDIDGTIKRDLATGRPVYDYGDGSSTNNTRNYMSMSNPKGDLLYNQEEYLMDIFNGKWFAEVTPIEGLKLTATLGYFVDNTRYHSLGNKFYGQSSSYGGTAYQNQDHVAAFNQQYLATYANSIDKHNFDILAGYEAYDYNTENVYATGQNLYKGDDYTINNTIDNKSGGGSGSEYSTRGILSRANYNYDEKYYASFSYRRDASSRFHPDHRWGNFWSASAAWMISKEDFMKSVDWVDMLKFKASFGQQGNDNIGNLYAYLDQYSVTGANGVFSDGTLAYKGNPNITWEKSNAFNVGFDFSFFKNKLTGTVEYFSRKTSDMLYNKPVANSNGYASIPMNIGSMTNSGFELELIYTPIMREDFNWTIFGNATTVKNKINELHPDLKGELISGSRIYKEGESMYQFYLVKYAGVDKSNGKALYWAEDADGNAITTSDYKVAQKFKKGTGDIMPKVYGGFGTSVEYKGFDFSIQFSYQLGGKIIDNTYQNLMHGGDAGNVGRNWHKDIAKAWTPENPNTDVPRLNSNETSIVNSISDRWMISSNYLSLNNITLGYTLPKSLLKNIGVESVRFYGAADNVALFAARKGLDPRQSYTASTAYTYSALRTISGGVKVTF